MKIIGYLYTNNYNDIFKFKFELSPLRALLKNINYDNDNFFLIQICSDIKDITEVDVESSTLNGISKKSLYVMSENEYLNYVNQINELIHNEINDIDIINDIDGFDKISNKINQIIDNTNKKNYALTKKYVSNLYDGEGYIMNFKIKNNCDCTIKNINNISSFIKDFYKRKNFTIDDENKIIIENYLDFPDNDIIWEMPVSFYNKIGRKKTISCNGDDFISKYTSHDMWNSDAIFDSDNGEYSIRAKNSASLISGNNNVIILEADCAGVFITGNSNKIISLADDVTIIDLGDNNKILSHIETNIIKKI